MHKNCNVSKNECAKIDQDTNGSSPLPVSSFWYISWPMHRNKLQKFVDGGNDPGYRPGLWYHADS